MKVKVEFFATLREIVKEKSIIVELAENSTVQDLLADLIERFGKTFKEAIYESKIELRNYIRILVNGRNIESIEGLKTKLNSNDEVAIFPPVAGG